MFALWYLSIALDELRKHFKFVDNIFVFFNGNDQISTTLGQPAIVSKESLNETDIKLPEISDNVPEVTEKEPEPPVETVEVIDDPKLDEVIEIDDVKSDEDSNPEKIVAFPANNDDSFMFVENQKSKRSTKDTTVDFLKSETNKLAETLPSADNSVVEEAKEVPTFDPTSPTKKIEESFIIVDEREKSEEVAKEDEKLPEITQKVEEKLDDIVEPLKSIKIDESFLIVDDQNSKKSVSVKDAIDDFLSAESGKPKTNGISTETVNPIDTEEKQDISNYSDSIPSETIGEEEAKKLEIENKLNESIESIDTEITKFDEGVEAKEDDVQLDEKSEPKSILEIDEEKIAAFLARAEEESFLIVDDKKPKKLTSIKEKTADFLQSEMKPLATSLLSSPSQPNESEPLQFTVMLKQKSSKIPKFKDMLPTTKLPTPKLLPSPASSVSTANRTETKEMIDDKIKHFAQDVTHKLEEIMKTPNSKLEQITELESEQFCDAKTDEGCSSPPALEQPTVEDSFILVKRQSFIPKLRFETNKLTNIVRYGTLLSFYINELMICGVLTVLIIYFLCLYDIIINT